jgi:hypothetical protein
MNILSKIKYLLFVPLIGLILYVLAWSAADAFSYQALLHERQWITERGLKSKRQWDAAVKWSTLAIRFDPYNPNYPEMLGRLHFWRFFIEDAPIASSDEAMSVINQGMSYLQESIAMRPTWPRAWASMLQLKSVGGQVDYEFEQIWDKAVELGDWEPEVQRMLLEAGLIHWSRSSPLLQQKTVSMFVAMTSKPFSEARAISTVERIGAWPLVCDVLVDPLVTPLRMRQACAEVRQQKSIPLQALPVSKKDVTEEKREVAN